MGLLVPILLAAVGSGGVIAALLKLWPERNNLTVDAAQKAVQLLRSTIEELAAELERALVKVAALQKQLELAIERTHELEQLLDTERRKVVDLEERLGELSDRHP